MFFEHYFENENGWLHIYILPNEHIQGDIFMISSWLEGDVQGGCRFLELFNAYMEAPDRDEYELSGNSCELLIKKDFTTIRWNWYDEVPDSCTLPTEMLYEILKVWVAKNKELREEEMKNEAKRIK